MQRIEVVRCGFGPCGILGVSPLEINLNSSRFMSSVAKALFGFAALIGLSMTAHAQTYYYYPTYGARGPERDPDRQRGPDQLRSGDRGQSGRVVHVYTSVLPDDVYTASRPDDLYSSILSAYLSDPNRSTDG